MCVHQCPVDVCVWLCVFPVATMLNARSMVNRVISTKGKTTGAQMGDGGGRTERGLV